MSSKPTTEQAPKLPEPAPAVPASPRLPRGPHQLSRAEVAANQRLRLVLAMIDTIGEKGYAPATVVDVVVGGVCEPCGGVVDPPPPCCCCCP